VQCTHQIHHADIGICHIGSSLGDRYLGIFP
jgi:hypothetical protein